MGPLLFIVVCVWRQCFFCWPTRCRACVCACVRACLRMSSCQTDAAPSINAQQRDSNNSNDDNSAMQMQKRVGEVTKNKKSAMVRPTHGAREGAKKLTCSNAHERSAKCSVSASTNTLLQRHAPTTTKMVRVGCAMKKIESQEAEAEREKKEKERSEAAAASLKMSTARHLFVSARNCSV